MKNILILSTLLFLSFSCQRDEAPVLIPNDDLNPGKLGESIILPEFKSSFEKVYDNDLTSACQRIKTMNAYEGTKDYSFLSYAEILGNDSNLSLDIGTNVAQSNVINKQITTLLKGPAGQSLEQYNRALPGITGKIESYKLNDPSAFPLPLLTKTSYSEDGNINLDNTTLDTLSLSMPLFYGSTWAEVNTHQINNMSSALKAFKSQDPSERACGLVLWQQITNQTLELTGYQASVTTNDPELAKKRNLSERDLKHISQFLPELTEEQPTLETYLKSPVVLNLKNPTKPVQLDKLSMLNYVPDVQVDPNDPDSKRVLLFKERNTGELSLKAQLGFLEMNLSLLEATSPASDWSSLTSYVVGDITDPQSPALLPAESHSAAIGFISMSFLNLEHTSIRPVDASGKLNLENPLGLAFGSHRADNPAILDVNINEVGQFIRIYADLNHNLEKILESENPLVKFVYDETTLGLLKKFQTKMKEARMSLALSLLMRKMNSPEGCASKLEWNLQTGKVQPTAFCTAQEKEFAVQSLNHLALKLKSSALYQKP